MKYSFLTFGLLCLSEQVSTVAAKLALRDAAHGSNALPHEAYLPSKTRKRAELKISSPDIMEREALPIPMPASPDLEPRQSAQGLTFAQLKAAMPTVSNNATDAACVAALKNSTRGAATNPSGMSMCYNVANYNNSTGQFEAHLLVYMIGPATGKWVGVDPGSETIGLQYPGASVTPVPSPSGVARRYVEERDDGEMEGRDTHLQKRDDPKLMKDLLFEGLVDSEFKPLLSNLTAMHFALQPNVTLAAKSPAGEQLNLTLNNTEAAFVNGFFSAAMFAAAAGPPAPFILPGTTLGIFPIGLIVTGAWAVLFIGFVGAGTIGRYNFRKAYRRRTGGAGGRTATGFAKAAAYDRR